MSDSVMSMKIEIGGMMMRFCPTDWERKKTSWNELDEVMECIARGEWWLEETLMITLVKRSVKMRK